MWSARLLLLCFCSCSLVGAFPYDNGLNTFIRIRRLDFIPQDPYYDLALPLVGRLAAESAKTNRHRRWQSNRANQPSHWERLGSTWG